MKQHFHSCPKMVTEVAHQEDPPPPQPLPPARRHTHAALCIISSLTLFIHNGSTSKVVLTALPFGQRLHLVHRRASRARLYLLCEAIKCARRESSSSTGQNERAGKEAETHSGKSRVRLTSLEMTYQITQRTGICPCPCFTSNCFTISRVCGFCATWKNTLKCLLIELERQFVSPRPPPDSVEMYDWGDTCKASLHPIMIGRRQNVFDTRSEFAD